MSAPGCTVLLAKPPKMATTWPITIQFCGTLNSTPPNMLVTSTTAASPRMPARRRSIPTPPNMAEHWPPRKSSVVTLRSTPPKMAHSFSVPSCAPDGTLGMPAWGGASRLHNINAPAPISTSGQKLAHVRLRKPSVSARNRPPIPTRRPPVIRPLWDGEVLGGGYYFEILRVVALQSFDEVDRHAPHQVGIFAVGLHAEIGRAHV